MISNELESRGSLRGVQLSAAAFALAALAATSCTANANKDAGANAGGAGSTNTGGKGTGGGSAGSESDVEPAAGTGGELGGNSAGGSEASGGRSGGGSGGAGGASAVPGCIGSIYGTYVLRKDGIAIREILTERVVLDDLSGTANTPLSGVVSVQEQGEGACAVMTDGTVQCWEQGATDGNVYGQLGNGNLLPFPLYRATAVLKDAATPLTGVVALARGWGTVSACAVTSAGELWCWGNLTWISNGGTTLYAPYAQRVTLDGQAPLTGVKQAALWARGACALIQGSPNNSVWCWGNGAHDELAQGNTKSEQYPVLVPGLTSPTQVVLSFRSLDEYVDGYGSACVLDGGAVRCWGWNGSGNAGSSATTNPVPAPTPVVVNSTTLLSGVVGIQEGYGGFGALRADGTIWLWGVPSGNTAFAKFYGASNVAQLGIVSDPARYLTNDGVYHSGMTDVIPVSCGAVQ